LQPRLRLVPHQVLGQDLGKAGHIVDELLRVERGELAAELLQAVHDLGGHLPHASVERAEEARRTATDDRNVENLLFSHRRLPSPLCLPPQRRMPRRGSTPGRLGPPHSRGPPPVILLSVATPARSPETARGSRRSLDPRAVSRGAVSAVVRRNTSPAAA